MFFGASLIWSSHISFFYESDTSICDPSPASCRLLLAYFLSASSPRGISVSFTEATSRGAHDESARQSFSLPGELQLSLVDRGWSGIEHRDLDAARGARLD